MGTMILVTVMIPDLGVGDGVVAGVDGVGEGIGVVTDELFDELDELRGVGVGVAKDD